MTLVALASVSVQAATIDDLVNTSGSIVQTFDTGIKAIAGMRSYSTTGGIAPDGTTDGGIITQAQADAYNNAIATLDATIDAQEYFNTQAETARQNLDNAISAYVGAAGAIIEVTVVNNMAQEAANSGDAIQAAEVQAYVTENNVTLETQEIDAYNDALTNVEEMAQATAAFTAIANNPELVAAADQAALDAGTTYSAANDAFFDSSVGTVSVDFVESLAVVQLDVTTYFKSVDEIFLAGEEDGFYLTGPTANPCFFERDNYEQCMIDNGLVF